LIAHFTEQQLILRVAVRAGKPYSLHALVNWHFISLVVSTG
jgi:hypothetical protein